MSLSIEEEEDDELGQVSSEQDDEIRGLRPDQQQYDDGTDEFAELPPELLANPAMGMMGDGFGAYDMEDNESMSMEDSNQLPDPDPAFVINEEAIDRFKRRVRQEEDDTKRGHLLSLITQQSKKQRLLEIESKDKSLLTPEEKKALKMIKRKNSGFSIDKIIVGDTEGVVTIPTKTPYQKRVDTFLGPSEDWEVCFGCSHGVGYTTIEKDVLDALRDFIVKAWSSGDAMIQAVLISQHYEETIRTTYNKNYKGHGQPLPEWCARQVYDCLSVHKLNNPYLWVIGTLRQLTEDQTYFQGIKYSYPSSILEHRKKPTAQDLQLNKDHQREYRETVKLQLALRKLDPKTMFGSTSDGLDFSKAGTDVVTTKTNVFRGSKQLRLTDMTKVNRKT